MAEERGWGWEQAKHLTLRQVLAYTSKPQDFLIRHKRQFNSIGEARIAQEQFQARAKAIPEYLRSVLLGIVNVDRR